MTDDVALLARLQVVTLAGAAALPGVQVDECGPFSVVLDLERHEAHHSFAVPGVGARPSEAEVDALLALFRRHHRVPRVELLGALAPDAEALLRERSFALERRGALMVCRSQDTATTVGGLKLQVLDGEAPDAHVRAFDRIQRSAFGDPPGDVDVVAFRARTSGGCAVLVWLDGQPVGTGVSAAPRDGCVLLIGIGVLSSARGRGVGTAITVFLAQRALEAGAEVVYLTADDDAAQRIYSRAGFAVAGEYAHLIHREAHD